MKPFEDLTDQELTALDAEQLQRYIDYECADRGVALLPPFPPAPPESPVKEDTEFFMVGSVLFLNKSEAEKVANAINQLPRYKFEWSGSLGYQKRVTRNLEDESVTAGKAFGDQLAGRLGSQIAEFEEQKKAYESGKAEHDRVAEKRFTIAGELRTAIAQATRRTNEIARIRAEHARYLELAEGNRRTAARFLLSVNPNAETICPELFVFRPSDPADVVRANSKRQIFDNELVSEIVSASEEL